MKGRERRKERRKGRKREIGRKRREEGGIERRVREPYSLQNGLLEA